MLRHRNREGLLTLSPEATAKRRPSPHPITIGKTSLDQTQCTSDGVTSYQSRLSQLTVDQGTSPSWKGSSTTSFFAGSQGKGERVKKTTVAIVIALIFSLTVLARDSYLSTSTKVDDLQEKLSSMKKERDSYESNFQHARKMANEITAAAQNLQERTRRLEKDRNLMNDQILKLKAFIQRESKREVVDRYGAGPYQVEFLLDLPLPHNKIIMKMAPLDLMPHSIHVFLEGIRHRIWDGKTFWLNPIHLVQAGHKILADPTKKEKENWNEYLNATEIEDSLTVSFPEYSDEFPHKPYTVGFAGTPGGPDFYISKRDNSVGHGPNGQVHHMLEGDADPCFAEIVSGFEVFGLMDSLETLPRTGAFKKPVGIIQASIVTSE